MPPRDKPHLLVVAAFGPELMAFAGLLARSRGGELRVDVTAEAIGVGLVAAACGAAAGLALAPPRGVVLVGTAGAYPGTGLSIGDVVAVRSAVLGAPAVVEGRAALPDPMAAGVTIDAAMSAALAIGAAASVVVATTLAVTTDDALAVTLSTVGGVEHLETFAVAAACAARAVPFAAVLGVANSVGSRGRAEWRAHHLAAGERAALHVARWVDAGAPGLPTG